MQNDWAAEHLQTIRTLMERSALYRRAQAPMMLLSGGVGIAAAIAGWRLHFISPRAFVLWWFAACGVAVVGSLLLVRRQAMKDAEPFWSPPARRVTSAMCPGLFIGGLLGLAAVIRPESAVPVFWLPPAWIALYGCSIHAAGFFMPRGIKLFGGLLTVLGGLLLLAVSLGCHPPAEYGHVLMGVVFGGAHLAYGVYLYFTEKKSSAT